MNDTPHLVGHHPEPVEGAGWEDDKRVLVEDFHLNSEEEPEDDAEEQARLRLIIGQDWLRFLTLGQEEPADVGRLCFLVAHLMGADSCESQLTLAKRLRGTPGRVSQLLKSLQPRLLVILKGFEGLDRHC
jgi:hypothetical protein